MANQKKYYYRAKKQFKCKKREFSNIFEFGNEYAILKNDNFTSCLPEDEDEELNSPN